MPSIKKICATAECTFRATFKNYSNLINHFWKPQLYVPQKKSSMNCVRYFLFRLFKVNLGIYPSTLKPWYNEPQYSEFCNIVNKTQLPFWGFTKHMTFDIVNYLTDLFAISRFELLKILSSICVFLFIYAYNPYCC